MTAAPDILVRRGIDRGLVGSTVASAVIHAALAALVLTMPGRLLVPAPKMESYTVDLVAPDVIGGTNLVQGGGRAKEPSGKSEPPPVVEPAPAAAAPKPAEPAVEAKAPAPEPAKPAPPAAQVVPPVKPPAPPPVVEPPKPAPPQPVAVQPPESKPAPPAKPAPPPKPPPVADAKPPEPKPAAKPVEPPKPIAKAEPAKPPPPARPAPAEKPAQPAAHEKPVEPPKDTAAERAAAKRDAEIAAAVQRRAASVQGGAGANGKDVDQRIAAAVQRRAQQVGAGSGPPAAGGLASVGPGSGAGGTPAGLEYILYQGKMNQRIKAAWAWAGTDKSLHAIVGFDLTPEGEIRNIHTIQSSGDGKYDASCERAVRAVNPLEPVPEKYRKEFSSVEMTFNANDREP